MSERPQAIIVVGMHRSGTSAATRALNLCGVDLGSRMLPAAADNNEKGFWEHADVVDLHERMLGSMGRTWADPRRMPVGWTELPCAHEARSRIRQLIETEFSKASLWAIKDPRICRLIPLWTSVLAECGVAANFLFVLREPREVAASLAQRDGVSIAEAQVLTLQHFFEAAAASVNFKRSVVTYTQLLDDWRGCLNRIGRDLQLEWPGLDATAESAIDAFLDQGSRHHRLERTVGAVEPSLPAQVYRLANEARSNDEFWAGVHPLTASYELLSHDAMPLLDELCGMVFARAAFDAGGRSGSLPDSTVGRQSADLDRLQFKMVRTLQDGVGKLGQASADLGAMIRVGNEMTHQVLSTSQAISAGLVDSNAQLRAASDLAQRLDVSLDQQRGGLGELAGTLQEVLAQQRQQAQHLVGLVGGASIAMERSEAQAEQTRENLNKIEQQSRQYFDQIAEQLDQVIQRHRRIDEASWAQRLRRLFRRAGKP